MKETLEFISARVNNFQPDIGIILGSGLGDFANGLDSICVPYSEIPGFETSTVQGHAGQLVFAELFGKKVVMMQGRYHFYEGHSLQSVTFPVKVMKKLGVKKLLITNAAGAINKDLKPADLMILTDHINFMGKNPLFGKNDDSLGTRFPDMSQVYKRYLIDTAENAAKTLGINIKKGVYAACTGPSYETPAEIKMLAVLGADAVGMSTVPEAIVANYCGIDVLGISCISNYAAGIQEIPLSHQEVIETTTLAKNKFKSLVSEILKNM